MESRFYRYLSQAARLARLLSVSRFWNALRFYVVGIYTRVDENHLFLAASGLAFALIVCIIPLILIIFSLLGMFLERTPLTEQIHAFIGRAIPYEAYAAYIKELVTTRVDEFTAFSKPAGIIGTIGLLFAASSLFSSMRTVLDTIYHIKDAESILIGKIRDLGLILMVMAFVLISTTILPSVDVIAHWADEIQWLADYHQGFVTGAVVRILSLSLIFMSFWLLYFFVPQKRQPQLVVLFSALWAALLWFIAKEAFGYYIVHFVTLKQIYGAYSLIIVVAFWIYYTAIVFIVGAEIGQLVGERRQQRLADTAPGA